ncbi:MAG TPA: M48 family metalloprotease [Candidatus Eisenbacteria bacterium]
MTRARRFRSFARAIPLALLAALCWIGGCATNPATGKRQISLVSENKELAIGRESDPAVIAEYGLYDDDATQRYVDSVGQRLARISHRPDLVWHFRVLDSPVVNAFAIPGGYIYITRGILAYMNSEAQLAGVLGHEIGHVTARHSAQQITRSEIAGLGVLVGMVFVDAFRPYGGLAQQGLGLLFLKYSRDNETQADELGIEYAAKAGYDPREIPQTYATLKRIGERAGSSLPSFLSTHPDPGDREIRTTQIANATAASARRGLEIGSVAYRRHIDGMVFGDDPRNGYFDANRFYHPQLAFQMIFPLGWQTANQPSQVVASDEHAGAAMQLSLATSRDTTLSAPQFVDSLRARGEIVEAQGRSENFRDYSAWVGNITAKGSSGQTSFVAGFVKIRGGQYLQVLGQVGSSNAAADQIFASIRSIAALRDPAKLNVTPDRVEVKSVPRAESFASVYAAFPGQALSLEDSAILNSTRAGTTFEEGAPVKVVAKGIHPTG